MAARALPILLLLTATAARAAPVDESLRTRALLIQAEDRRDPEAVVLLQALASRDALLRARALRALGRIGEEGHVAVVARALTDARPAVRHEAAFALGEIESPAAFDSLRRALLTRDPELAGLAAEALSKIRWDDEATKRLAGTAVVEALLAVEARSAGATAPARRRALLVAWRFGKETPGLVESLLALDGRSFELRADVADALVYCAGRLRDPRLAPILKEAAAGASTAFARSQAARGLGALAAAAVAAGEETDPEARRLLVDLARSERTWSAIEVQEEQEGLLLNLELLPPTSVRVAGLRALAAFPAPDEEAAAMRPIAGALTASDHHVRSEAIGLAGAWRVAGARPLLEGMLTQEGQPDLQTEALAALVAIEGKPALKWVGRFAASPDWRLRAAAAAALGEPHRLGSSGELGSGLLDELLLDTDARVVAAALGAVGASGRPDAVVLVLAQLQSRDPVVRAVAASSLIELVSEPFGQDEAEAALRAVERAGDGELPESTRRASLAILVRLLGEDSRAELEAAYAAGRLDSDSVLPAISSRLGRLPLSEAEAARALRAVLRAASGEVPADARLVALESLVELLGKGAVPDLESAFRDPEFTVRLAARRLAKQVGASALAATPVGPVGTDLAFDEYLTAAARERDGGVVGLHLVTERGLIDLELFPGEAVLTVRRFLALARSGWFDGLSFHRVVPDFVVQGGDPRGDGWGGPESSMRCEVNPLRYGRGVLGVALSGKDTGGSQFFLTLSPQPHLDGGYTVFGRARPESMPVVDALRRHDRILAALTDDLVEGEAGGDS